MKPGREGTDVRRQGVVIEIDASAADRVHPTWVGAFAGRVAGSGKIIVRAKLLFFPPCHILPACADHPA